MNKMLAKGLLGFISIFLSQSAYATCTTNTTNTSNSSTTTLNSTTAGDCVLNSGSITTTGAGGYGIYSSGASSTINNSGTIMTSGGFAYGVYSANASIKNTNSGTIMTNGYNGYGIVSTGTSNTNTNTGSITTSGDEGYGLFSTGISSTNTNSGSITTSGDNGYGIVSAGASITNTNSGSITTSGAYGAGIFSNGTSSTNTNSGTITTSGAGGSGIYSRGASSTNTNSGTIMTSGADGYGIYSDGASSTITNTGTIITSGYYGHGVVLGGNNSTLDNYGLIKSTGDSFAIYWRMSGSNGVVNLKRGSVIVGNMVAGDHVNPRLNINLGSSASYAYSVSNHVIVTDLDNRPMVTGSAYAAGIGAQETAAEMLYQRTSVVNSALDRRLRAYASDEVESQPYWLDVYYADVTRNSGGNFSTQTAFSNHNYGMTAGFKLPVQFTPLELVVNVEQNNLNIDSGNQRIDSSSIMAGFLAPSITEVLGAKLSAKALVGYADHDGDRKVMTNSLLYDGSRQIKSDYNSTYAVLGTALTKLYPITDRLTADVILGLDLNTQRFESYKETDYFAWDSRTLNQLQSRVQTGLDYKLWGDKGSVFARVGAEHRDLIGGTTQDYSINGTNVSFNTNNKNDTYLTAQVGIKAQLEKRIQLFGIVNTLHSSDSVNSVSGNIGLRADF